MNMVADLCEFTVDHRFCPGTNYREPLKMIKEALGKEAKRFKVRIDDIQQPYEIKADPIHMLRSFWMSISDLRHRLRSKGSEGATVITFFQKHKIPAFATGWGAHGTLHANDEYIYIKSLYRGTQVLEEYIKEYDKM